MKIETDGRLKHCHSEEPSDEESAVPQTPPRMSSLVHTAALFLSCLREIFDESAYRRFLSRHQMSSSPEAYAEFSREQTAGKARPPRCC